MKLHFLNLDSYCFEEPIGQPASQAVKLTFCCHSDGQIAVIMDNFIGPADLARMARAMTHDRRLAVVHMVCCRAGRPHRALSADAWSSSYAAQLSTNLPGVVVEAYVNDVVTPGIVMPDFVWKIRERHGEAGALQFLRNELVVRRFTRFGADVYYGVKFLNGEACSDDVNIVMHDGKTYAIL